jgi:hypothetical protein
MTEVLVSVVGFPDSDEEERAELASRLRDEMRERGIDDVEHPAAEPPPGSKGGALEWAQLVVTLAGTVPSLAMASQGWLGRHPNAAVTLEIDGDRLTLDEASAGERQRLLETFLARHGDG